MSRLVWVTVVCALASCERASGPRLVDHVPAPAPDPPPAPPGPTHEGVIASLLGQVERGGDHGHAYRPDFAYALYHRGCFDHGEPWACFAIARSHDVFCQDKCPQGRGAPSLLDSLERGCDLDGPGKFVCGKLECKRADPDHSVMDCPSD